ncbi:MAG: ATP-binding protein [Bacteroidota bacterium]|nr:ATP-binding protein [Bacteroidota bacterium]
MFQGRNGCGKTHLAAAIGNYQLQKGKPVFFLSASSLNYTSCSTNFFWIITTSMTNMAKNTPSVAE